MENKLIENTTFFEYDDIEMEPIEATNSLDSLDKKLEQESNTNEILAEMCFMEAEDLLSRGDRSGAIVSYKQAYNYFPRSIKYCLKLIDLLSEDQHTCKEAESILNQALELTPSNLELSIRFNKLRNKSFGTKKTSSTKEIESFLQQTEITTQKIFKEDIKAVAKEMGVDLEKVEKTLDNTTATDTVAMLKELDELEAKNSFTSPLTKKSVAKETKLEDGLKNSVSVKVSDQNATATILKEIDKLETKSIVSTPKPSNAKKSTETLQETNTHALTSDKSEKAKPRKTKYISSSVNTLPKKVSGLKWLVVSLVFLIAVSGLAYKLLSRPTIILLEPNGKAALEAKDVKFEWKSSKAGDLVVLEVYEDERFIIKEFVKEGSSYTPSPEQLTLFSPEHTYRWRIALPQGFVGNYSFVSDMKSFSVSKAFEPIKKLEEQNNPKQDDQPQRVSPPTVEPRPSYDRKSSESGKGEI